jgi:hypothetical protein
MGSVMLASDHTIWIEKYGSELGACASAGALNALGRIWEKRFNFLVNSPQYVARLLLSF